MRRWQLSVSLPNQQHEVALASLNYGLHLFLPPFFPASLSLLFVSLPSLHPIAAAGSSRSLPWTQILGRQEACDPQTKGTIGSWKVRERKKGLVEVRG